MTKPGHTDRVWGGLWGALAGDALGVPVEFKDRAFLHANPVREMRGFGTHHQPPGTWSDDGSMTLCTIDSLLHHDFDIEDMGQRFVRWMREELWTAHGEVFDMGGTTCSALLGISRGIPAAPAGGQSEDSNGNGSLMRILPVAMRFAHEPTASLLEKLSQASAITHAHARSRLACGFFGLMVRQLLAGVPPAIALAAARADFSGIYQEHPEFSRFKHILQDHFETLLEGEIVSTGYVLHTLHASLWCLITSDNFSDCVLRAVNLGGDTDTIGWASPKAFPGTLITQFPWLSMPGSGIAVISK